MKTVCPISNDKVDENVARLNGFATILFTLLGLTNVILLIFLSLDFLFRIITPRFSIISRLNRWFLDLLDIEPRPIDAMPKKFAAGMGFTMLIILIISSIYHLQIIFYIFLILLVIAASLESIVNFCLGCYIFSLLISIKSLVRKLF